MSVQFQLPHLYPLRSTPSMSRDCSAPLRCRATAAKHNNNNSCRLPNTAAAAAPVAAFETTASICTFAQPAVTCSFAASISCCIVALPAEPRIAGQRLS